MSKVKKGIITYKVEKNGCLNGIYTNEVIKGIIYNEIAKKQQFNNQTSNDLSGTYDYVYFENQNKQINGELIIVKQPNSEEYSLEWRTNNKLIFKGYGYKMDENQFVVRYESC